MVHIENFRPYFYLECANDFTRKDFEKHKKEMMKIIFNTDEQARIYSQKEKQKYVRRPMDIILVWKENLLHFKGKGKGDKYFIKIICDGPNSFFTYRKNCEENYNRLVNFKIRPNMYESGLPYPLRFMIDHHLSGMSWMTLSQKKYRVISSTVQSTLSKCQKEIIIDYKNLIPRDFSDPKFSSIASLRIMSFDIECYSKRGFPNPESNPVITIGICCTSHDKDDQTNKIVLQLDSCEPIPECQLLTFGSEKLLLETFNKIVDVYDPDILTGYNIQTFDMDYMLSRMKALKMETPNWGRHLKKPTYSKTAKIMAKSMGFRETKSINVNGRIQMDMMMHMLKEKKFSSYSLNNVSFLLLGEQKEDVPYNMISVLQDGEPNDRKRLASYCLKDSVLPIRLMNKLKVIYNNVEMARVTGVPINYLFTRGQQIKVVSQIHNDTKKKNLLVPGKSTYTSIMGSGGPNREFGGESKSSTGFQGAYVLEPKPDFYTVPIATLDFASLYPSIMIRHNLCYSTILSSESRGQLSKGDIEFTPEGSQFVKSNIKKGILPQILENLLSARKRVKGEMKQKNKQLAQVKTRLEQIEQLEADQEKIKASNDQPFSKRKLSENQNMQSFMEEMNGANSNFLLDQMNNLSVKERPQFEILKLKEDNKENLVTEAIQEEVQVEELSTEQMQELQNEKRELNEQKKNLENSIAVMDGRQLALKISANSVYGFTGAQRGHMPCLEIAGSVTAYGRKMIDHTKNRVMELYTTKNGHEFDADVIYGDTDSVMIKFGSNNLEECMELGKQAADILTSEFEKPIKLEFEKVYYPYLLLSKKRYAGNFWTRPEKPDKKDCKGLESVRRDNCLLVRTMVGKVIDILLNEMDQDKAKDYVKNRIYDLQNGNIDLSKLIISKSLSKNLDVDKLNQELESMGISTQNSGTSGSTKSKANVYTNNSPHVSLAERLYKRNPHNPPMIGDRIPYVIIKGPRKSKLYENSEDPLYALEKDLPIDIDYYIEKQIKPPMKRIFDVVIKNHDIFTGKQTTFSNGRQAFSTDPRSNYQQVKRHRSLFRKNQSKMSDL
jgi:DNA polymerase elongation subunit (family B)